MSSMFKKRGGLAFKPKISRRPQPASITTSQQSNSADKPKEAAPPEAAASAEVPSLPQATPEPNASNTAAPPEPSPSPPLITSEQEAPNVSPTSEESDDPLSHPHTTDQPVQDVTVTDESSAGTASRLGEPPSEPLGPNRHEATPPESFIDKEAAAASAASAESEPPEQSSVPSPEVVDTRADSIVPDASPSTLDSAPPKQRKRATQSVTPKNKAAKPTSSEPSQPEPKKRQRKPKRTQADGEEQQDGEEVPEGAPKKRQRKSREGTQAKPRRARSLTPEDAETQLVDHQKLTMADLTRDLHIGKKFSRHDELRERERLARAKAKAGKNGDDDGDTEADGSNLESSSTENARPTAPSTPGDSQQQQQGSGVQFRIVDGQIVLDQSSLVMDRHARAAAAQRDMETIEENDFTRLITSSSYMSSSKLRGPNVWTAEETVLFYRGLEMFGTDFEIIAQMFPGKQRRQVKLKFNREERHNPKLVDAALIGVKKTRMNMDEYKALTGGEFESVESIEAQHREQEEHFEARQKQLADEQAEIMRKKREELFADDDGGGGGVDGGEGSKKKKGKGKRRGADSAALGDPEIVMDM